MIMDYRKKAESMELPPMPWTHAALGEEKYCELARELGYFEPRSEKPDFRPPLDATPYKDLIKATKKEK
jgi:hypothetical protein